MTAAPAPQPAMDPDRDQMLALLTQVAEAVEAGQCDHISVIGVNQLGGAFNLSHGRPMVPPYMVLGALHAFMARITRNVLIDQDRPKSGIIVPRGAMRKQ